MLLISLFSFFCLSVQGKLIEFQAKQSNYKIRYISNDGLHTFYQKRNGTLSYAIRNKVFNVLTMKPNSQYHVSGDSNNQNFLIEVNENYHDNLNLNLENDIYILGKNSSSPQKIGRGIGPQFHLEGLWISYYSPTLSQLTFQAINSKNLVFNIKVKSEKNPFFRPYRVMLDNNTALTTAINKKGTQAILKHSFIEKDASIFYKIENPGIKIELCEFSSSIAVGLFPLIQTGSGSQIVTYPKSTKIDFSRGNIVYEAKQDDIGNTICVNEQKRIYFIKKTKENLKSTYEFESEAAYVDIISRKYAVISELKYVTQLIKMDQRILLPYRDKIYVIKGSALESDRLDN